MIDSAAVLERCPDVRFRIVDDEGVVVRQSTADIIVINDVGARILDLVDGERPVARLVENLISEYDVPEETLSADLHAYLGELIETGVLREKEK